MHCNSALSGPAVNWRDIVPHTYFIIHAAQLVLSILLGCPRFQICEQNERLLSKLSSRNETLEEREERRAKRRAACITARFGYTPEDNPFRDPNLHETFTWKKKEEKRPVAVGLKYK